MLQFDLQLYEKLTVARVKTVKFISGAFFWPTGQLVFPLQSNGAVLCTVDPNAQMDPDPSVHLPQSLLGPEVIV